MAQLEDGIRDQLARGVASRAELQRELKASQPSLSRAIGNLGDQLARIGRGRTTRYGLRREIAQIGSSWPVFTIDAEGRPHSLGKLEALVRDQYWFAATAPAHSQLSDGLPFFLQDLWPQGFIGRTVSRRFPELGLPERVTDWDESHVLTYLIRRGEDSIGNLLVGDESLGRFFEQSQDPRIHIDSDKRSAQYPQLADSAIAGSPAGSSAGGEHPKFTAVVRTGTTLHHVLVKFSPVRTDRVAQRWSDLLIAEHIASNTLRTLGIPSARTELLVAGNRMFLESERFDRVGARGRIGIISLAALADHHIGRRDNWIAACRTLSSIRKITEADADVVRRAATLGRMIGNTDMHFGNLSFFFAPGNGAPTLAPLYDMLPMMYAPVGAAELPDLEFQPPLPGADTLDIWTSTAGAAEAYWQEVASHPLISQEFALRATRNAGSIARSRKLVSNPA